MSSKAESDQKRAYLALSADGALLTSEQAVEALAVGHGTTLRCLFCRGKVSVVRQHCRARGHFRHVHGLCGNFGRAWGESEEHLMGKSLILRAGNIPVPASLIEGPSKPTPRKAAFRNPRIERSLGSVRPDLIVQVGRHRVAVEVRVTHACTQEKIRHLLKLGITVMEVDISMARGRSLSLLRAVIEEQRNWKCLADPVGQEVARRSRADKIAASDRELRAMEKAWRHVPASPKVSPALMQAQRDYQGLGLTGVATGPLDGQSYFLVEDNIWQTAVLLHFIQQRSLAAGRPSISIDGICTMLVEEGLILQPFAAPDWLTIARLTHNEGIPGQYWHGSEPLREDFFGIDEVRRYLIYLAERYVIRPANGAEAWMYSQEWHLVKQLPRAGA